MSNVKLSFAQEQEIRGLLKEPTFANRVEAMRRVQNWSKAGLKESKDYVDAIVGANNPDLLNS